MVFDWQISETKEVQEELDRTSSELRRLQAEVSKKNLEIEQIALVESLKSAVQRLEKEKLEVTVNMFLFLCEDFHWASNSVCHDVVF